MKFKSSNLKESVYVDGVLTMTFNNGNVYEYYDVPEEVVNKLYAAPSAGSFFYSNIRTRYKFRKKE